MVPNHQPDSNLPPFDPSSSPHRHVTQRGCDSTWRWQVWAHSSLRQGGELNLTLVVSTCSTPKWTVEEVEAWKILVQPGFWPSNIGFLNGLVSFDHQQWGIRGIIRRFCWVSFVGKFHGRNLKPGLSASFCSSDPSSNWKFYTPFGEVSRGQGLGNFLEFYWWKVHKQK